MILKGELYLIFNFFDWHIKFVLYINSKPNNNFINSLTSLVAQTVKRLTTMRETRVRLLGQEDPLEKEMATHSSILAWRIPWTQEPGGLLGQSFPKS